MSLLIATVGDTHTCPMITGTVPHVGGTIITGYAKMLVNNKPVARMGDKCICTGCGMVCTIIQGNANVLVDGMPIAYVGCMTSHGGVITSGQVNAFLSGSKPPKLATMPIEIIDFSNITVKNRVIASIVGKGTQLKEAENNQQVLKEQVKNESEEKREITIESSYPLNELNEYARQFGASFFMYAMEAIFGESSYGENLPLHAYDYLYRDLSDKKVKMPKIKIHTGKYPEAKYNSTDNIIWIAQYLVLKATEEDNIDAMGKLYHALMEEFGHFIDWELRNKYTTLGGDAKLDEGAVFGYCLTTFNIFEEDVINFGKAVIDGKPYDLKIELSEIKNQINELVTQERIRRDEQYNDEEYFSAGKQTLKEAGGFTHYGIEEVLKDNEIIKSELDLNQIYLGNLLRDWSQLITPSTERYTADERKRIVNKLGLTKEEEKEFFGLDFLNPIKLSRKYLSYVIELIACHELVGEDLSKEQISASKGDEKVNLKPTKTVQSIKSKSSRIKDAILDKSKSLGIKAIEFSAEYYIFKKYFPEITSDLIGVYRPEEHIDNPMLACVVDLEKDEYLYWKDSVDPDINNHFGMKSYIRNYNGKSEQFYVTQDGVKPKDTKLKTASAYLTEQLKKSFEAHEKGEKKLSLLYFGNAMHTVEDYFAHSNFVELSLIKLGYRNIIPWINRNDSKVLQFNKSYRNTDVFENRDPLQNYFDDRTKIGNFMIYDLYDNYPEAKTPAFDDKNSFMFDKNGATYQFIYSQNSKFKGELHLLSWVPIIINDKNRKGRYLNHLPIVTGKFGPLDMIYSLSDKIETMFETDSFSWKDLISSEWEGKPIIRLIDLIALTILTDLKYAQQSEQQKTGNYKGVDYVTIIEYYEHIITFRGIVFGVLEKMKKGKGAMAIGAWVLITLINLLEKIFKNIIKKVLQFIVQGIATGIRESQNIQKLDTNPTHTQIAKDDMKHPLHLLAGNLARIAVADIGRQYDNLKKNRIKQEYFLKLAQEYLSHPVDVNWMDVSVMKWASKDENTDNIKNAKNKGVLDKLQKDHHHHVEEANQHKREFIEKIETEIEELKDLFEKASDMLEDAEITKKTQKSLQYIKNKFK